MRPIVESDIDVGKPLLWPIFDRAGKLLFDRGEVIPSENHLGVLFERGQCGAPEGTKLTFSVTSSATVKVAGNNDLVFDGVRALKQELQILHYQLLSGTPKDFNRLLLDVASRLKQFADQDSDAALAAMQLDISDDSIVARLIHAAILAQVFAKSMNLPVSQHLSLVAAALTYDVALTPIISVLNRQTSGLTRAQRIKVDAHPAEAMLLLQAAGVTDRIWIDAVVQHHERLDGTGYPDKLAGDDISLHSRMLSIVDIFSAMVRPRAYREAVNAKQALRDIFLERGSAVDESLARVFIKEIGVYPPGTLVRLGNREVAVIARRASGTMQPEVRCVVNADGSLANSMPVRDTTQPDQAIIEAVAHDKYRSVLTSINKVWRTSRPAPA